MSVVECLSQPLWQRLSLTLVHFLWQGLAVAVFAGALVRLTGSDAATLAMWPICSHLP